MIRPPEGTHHPDLDVILALRRKLNEVLEPLVPRNEGIALVDFPHTANVGDSVIWMGTLAWLASSGRGLPRYTCSDLTYDPAVLARRVGKGTILLSGGGNFGDLYKNHQMLRERVLTDFPENRIVQLPQSIRFESREALARTRQIVDAHAGLTLLMRDRSSLDFARNEFRRPSVLCPDMSLGLGPLSRPFPPTRPVVWLSRRDKEARAEPVIETRANLERQDWVTDDPQPIMRVNQRVGRLLRHRPAWRPWLSPWLGMTFTSLAHRRVERGKRVLSAGEVVVTNRLHGHLLALLLGIPHYVADNSYGKVRGFHETWTQDSKLTRFCETQAEALERALAGEPVSVP